ncbi:site-2 protease family protein [Patescibacteria group bacterium]|nr:site-2 protease family protein [Patescibacteria group bacterium]
MLSVLFQEPLVFLIWIFAILIALSVHEFSHALAATLQGDQTAKNMGRLTLNPVAHVDPLGILALILAGFGWGKPVPFNTYNLRNQKWGPVFIAFAGPAMNLVVATVAVIILRFAAPALGDANLLVQLLFLLVFLNLALLLFNLIPIPPLDGSKFLLAVLSKPSQAHIRLFLETRGPFLLIGLIILDSLLNLNLFGFLFTLIGGFIRVMAGI